MITDFKFFTGDIVFSTIVNLFNDFIGRLSSLTQDGAMEIYAWVLLPNHFHVLCKTKNMSLAYSMRRLLTGFVVKFNKRHRRHGHLFQNRYKSMVCQERELGYSGADVARYLGVTNSCVTRMISTGRKQDIDDINLDL
jgi:REP element-mobilizing transposase RayT